MGVLSRAYLHYFHHLSNAFFCLMFGFRQQPLWCIFMLFSEHIFHILDLTLGFQENDLAFFPGI